MPFLLINYLGLSPLFNTLIKVQNPPKERKKTNKKTTITAIRKRSHASTTMKEKKQTKKQPTPPPLPNTPPHSGFSKSHQQHKRFHLDYMIVHCCIYFSLFRSAFFLSPSQVVITWRSDGGETYPGTVSVSTALH